MKYDTSAVKRFFNINYSLVAAALVNTGGVPQPLYKLAVYKYIYSR
jgi:hypothetical protein